MKSYFLFILFAVLTAFVYSSPLPQEAPPGPPAGGEKKIVVVGLGPGPWSVGSSQVATWWSTGFTSDDPVTVTTHEESGTTPIFSEDSTLNKGSTQIPINDQYQPGTNYVTEVSLKSDPSIKGVGPAFTVTGGGGGPEAGAPPKSPKEPDDAGAPPKEPEAKVPEAGPGPPKGSDGAPGEPGPPKGSDGAPPSPGEPGPPKGSDGAPPSPGEPGPPKGSDGAPPSPGEPGSPKAK